MRPGARRLFGKRPHHGANLQSKFRVQITKVADYCAAQWPVFTPPLTIAIVGTASKAPTMS
jgi:hypothetical protein